MVKGEDGDRSRKENKKERDGERDGERQRKREKEGWFSGICRAVTR